MNQQIAAVFQFEGQWYFVMRDGTIVQLDEGYEPGMINWKFHVVAKLR